MPLDEKNLYLASQVIELSETDSYIDLIDRVCYYDNANLNGVQLDYDETSYEKAQTLVNQPVLAYYKTDEFGNPTLGGHEMKRVGGKTTFATQAIGTHLNAWIEDAEVELVSGERAIVKCLFSTIRLWKRFENCVSAAKNLFEKGKLYNSWEIVSSNAYYENNIKHLRDYNFIGNCLLGTAYPAYGKASHVYEAAEFDEEPQLLIAEALSADLIDSGSASNINHNQLDNSESDRKEMTPNMEANENIVVENSEVVAEEEAVETVAENQEVENASETQVEDTAEAKTEEVENNEQAEVSDVAPESDNNTEPEQSESDESGNDEHDDASAETNEVGEKYTIEDIDNMIYKAVRVLSDEDEENRYYVAMIFPEEHIVLLRTWKMKSLQYIQYSYRIEGDKAVLDDRQEVELNISPLNINSEIESKNNAIADANNRIVELENQNAELIKAKEELDQIKASQADAEHAEAVNKLREYVVKSGRFTEEEIASEDVQKAINDLNEAWIKAEIADRLVASMTESKKPEVEASSANEDKAVSIVLGENEEKSATSEDIMRAFFNRD